MIITAEISYYPFSQDFDQPISEFIQKITKQGIEIETGKMSTLITGDYSAVMQTVTFAMKDLFERYPSVFNLKISNSCIV